ncbi:MAG: HypC/HybG/HupF family hydrogenase formation chaperone [Planctomycetota bacterium]
MCLAVPGKVVECGEEDLIVDCQGNRLTVCKVLTPEVGLGDWVLVHAGFSVSLIEEQAALETWDYLRQCYGSAVFGVAASPAGGGGGA